MANLHAELKVALANSGVPDNSPILDYYLDWAGIRTKNSLAMFFADSDKISEWIDKFQVEISFGTPEKKIHFPEEDRCKGFQTCMIATWTTCRDDFEAIRQSKLSLTATPTLTPTPTPTTTPGEDKVPKAWPKGVYNFSPTIAPAPGTPRISPRRYSSAPRRSWSECGTNTPHPRTIKPLDLEKSSPTAPLPPPEPSTAQPNETKPTRPWS